MSEQCHVCGAAERNTNLCRPCAEELEKAIGDFPALLHEVSVLATGQTNVYRSSPARRGPDEELAGLEEEYRHREAAIPAWLRSKDGRRTLTSTRLPCNLDARDLLSDAYDTLLTWASIIGADEISSRLVVAWLLSHMQEIRLSEDAAQAFDEITYLHRRIERAVDRSPARIYAGPCETPDCQQLNTAGVLVPTSLYAPWGPAAGIDEHANEMNDKEFTCDGHPGPGTGCGAIYTWSARRPWLIENIKSSMVTIGDVIDAMPVLFREWHVPKRNTITAWVSKGRLMSPQNNDVGEPLYSGAALLDLIENYEPREYAPRPTRRRNVA